MRVFNRVVVLLLLVGLFLLGLFGALYSFGLLGYQLADLSSYVESAAGGSLGALGIAVLIAVAVVGLILLILEFKPRTPRRVRMKKGTYITRATVKERVEEAAGGSPGVLESSAKVKARRKSGAKVKLQGGVASGQDVKAARKRVGDRIKEKLGEAGVPIGSMKVNLSESDPRQAQRLTGEARVHAFVGGMHLTGGIFERLIPRTLDELAAIAPRWLVPGHCTGWRATHEIARRLPEAYVQTSVGTRLQFT